MKADFWRQEGNFWKRQGAEDLRHYCAFLRHRWALSEGLLDVRARMLLVRVSVMIYRDALERRKLLEAGCLNPERKDFAFYILGFIYRQKFKLSEPPLKTAPEDLTDYPTARASAVAASWNAVGKDCEDWWENWLNNALLESGASETKKAPSRRIRRGISFDEMPTSFVCGNWIQWHLWLMTPDVRLSFVSRHCAQAKAVTLEALNKMIRRARLYCHPDPPITGFVKKTGELRVK